MVSFIDGLRSGIRSAYCAGLAVDNAFLAGLRRVAPIPLIPAVYDRVAKLVCDRPSGGLPAPTPTVTGGQCPGVLYQVQDFGTNNTTGAAFSRNLGNFRGPIVGGVGYEGLAPLTCGVNQILFQWGYRDGNGNLIARSRGCGPIAGTHRVVCTPLEPEPGGGCGDGYTGTELPPAAPVTKPVNVTYGDNNEFNLTVPVIFAPAYVSIDGSINIPINIPDLDLIGELALNGEFNIDLNFGGNKPPNSGDDGPKPTPDPEGGDPEDEPEEERGDIVGVFVVVVDLPTERATFIAQDRGPDIIAPRAASVKFKVCADGKCGWSEDLPVKSSNAWVPVPGKILATDVQVTPDFGAEVEFSIVRERPVEA